MKAYGVQHIGFTVPDMVGAVAFFETLFGAVSCLSTGKLDVAMPTWSVAWASPAIAGSKT